MAVFTGKIEIGTRVYCSLYYCGEGIIIAKHGEEKPGSVQTMGGGVGVTGGGADYDIVWLQGKFSVKCPEALVRGSVQWRVLSDEPIATPEEIAQAVAYAKECQEAKALQDQREAEAFSNGVEKFKASPEFAYLTQGDDCYSGKLAATNIRAMLKKNFKGVKFSVRKTRYGSLSIEWTDGPTKDQIGELVNRFKAGYFDGQEDIYKNEISPWIKVFGGVEYLNLHRDLTDEVLESAITEVMDDYGWAVDYKRPTVQDFRGGKLFYVQIGAGNMQGEIHRRAGQLSRC